MRIRLTSKSQNLCAEVLARIFHILQRVGPAGVAAAVWPMRPIRSVPAVRARSSEEEGVGSGGPSGALGGQDAPTGPGNSRRVDANASSSRPNCAACFHKRPRGGVIGSQTCRHAISASSARPALQSARARSTVAATSKGFVAPGGETVSGWISRNRLMLFSTPIRGARRAEPGKHVMVHLNAIKTGRGRREL